MREGVRKEGREGEREAKKHNSKVLLKLERNSILNFRRGGYMKGGEEGGGGGRRRRGEGFHTHKVLLVKPLTIYYKLVLKRSLGRQDKQRLITTTRSEWRRGEGEGGRDRERERGKDGEREREGGRGGGRERGREGEGEGRREGEREGGRVGEGGGGGR